MNRIGRKRTHWLDKSQTGRIWVQISIHGACLQCIHNVQYMYRHSWITLSIWYLLTSNFAKKFVDFLLDVAEGITKSLHQSLLWVAGVRTSQEHTNNRWGLTSLRTASNPTDDAALTSPTVVDSVTRSFLLVYHRLITSCGVDPRRKLRPDTRGCCVLYRYSVHRRAERRSEDLTLVALFSRPSEDDTGALLIGNDVVLLLWRYSETPKCW